MINRELFWKRCDMESCPAKFSSTKLEFEIASWGIDLCFKYLLNYFSVVPSNIWGKPLCHNIRDGDAHKMLKGLIASGDLMFLCSNKWLLSSTERLCIFIHIWMSFKSIKLSGEFLLLFYFGVFNNIIISDKKCANDFNLSPTSRDVLPNIVIMTELISTLLQPHTKHTLCQDFNFTK